MNSVVIFIPEFLKKESPGFLLGVHKEKTETECETFYILAIEPYSPKKKFKNNNRVIGCLCSPVGDFSFVPRKKNWVEINNANEELGVQEVIINNVVKDFSLTRIIVYDKTSLLQSELFLSYNQDLAPSEKDYFKKLAYCLKTSSSQCYGSFTYKIFLPVLQRMIFILNILHSYFLKWTPVLKFSTLGLHIRDTVKNMLWFLETLKKEKQISLSTGNYLASFLVDAVSGFVMLHILMNCAQADEIFLFISTTTEEVVKNIILLVDWLMGSPAGLKLNRPLNQILGSFFLYNINLWWAFLGIMRPLLEWSFFVFLRLGLLGLTFQIAVIADVFNVVTFHIYCIYIYAARLFELQVNGLFSLSRLFLGRNRNPDPGRVDSCPYTTEQLFVGTISFTVLLFLLPTTLVYYVVFVIMRLGVTLVSGILSRARYFLQTLPVYSTWMWLFYPNYTAVTVKMKAGCGSRNPDSLILHARLVCGSWWSTTMLCIPQVITQPVPLNLRELFSKMVSGKIISPI